MEAFISSAHENTPFCSKSLRQFSKDLVSEGLITQDQLLLAKASEENLGIDLGNILIKRHFISEKALLKFLAHKLQIPLYEPKDDDISREVLRKFPFHLAKKHVVLPLCVDRRDPNSKEIMVLMSDPTNGEALEDLRSYYPDGFRVMLGSPRKIIELLNKNHQESNAFEGATAKLELAATPEDDLQTELEAKKIHEIASGAKIIAAVNNMMIGAKKERASDIHIEPYRDTIRIRYRIDGFLYEKGTLPRSMHLPIVSRIKIMGNMNIAERRVPQDGKTRVIIGTQALDLRISSCPTQFGEKVVLRLLSKDTVKTIEGLGFTDEDRKRFIEVISRPNGILLVTGPTGSGKSSTLYAALMRLSSPKINIITIEDPAESELEGVNQVSTNEKTGLTFASVLRSALRQDPDVIMIGEIRDAETAEISVRAAITGHMVLSTLHTNTAAGAVDRLIDLGLEPFLLSSSLRGVLAQRLVRKICDHCKEKTSTENEFHISLAQAFHGKGCEECNHSGYTGRIGIFELLVIDQSIRDLIHDGKGEEDIKKYMIQHNMPTILQDGIKKVEKGITTLSEVMRMTLEEE